MTENRIAGLLRTKSRFLRSANLERDFRDPEVFSGYVVSDFTEFCLNRLSEGLKPTSGQRAWRLTGDYGSGKSSFALLLAHWFAGNDKTLPRQIRSAIEPGARGALSRKFLPALVTCSRQPLTTSILQALRQALVEVDRFSPRARLVSEIEALLRTSSEPSEDAILDLIRRVNSSIIASSKSKGLLLIIDELGKFLEFAATHPERHDVFLLQRLAEAACRSGGEPFFLVCLLHQGFSAYADYLNQSAQREWEKVAGRFEEIIFNQPLATTARLVSSALNVRTDLVPKPMREGVKKAMGEALALGWYGPIASQNLTDIAVELYPLHPTVLPVLIRTFRRFGQNERSLFSFLLSSEPFGLQAFSQRQLDGSDPYSLYDFYDYVRTNFGHRLAVQSYRSHWNLIDSVIESFATDDELLVKILRTVGILNLLNDTDLLPTEDAIVCSLAGHDAAQRERVRAGLRKLRKDKRVLYDRGRTRGLCLWPHTSVDLEKAYEDARRAVTAQANVASLIREYLEIRPVVARRHYIETGNLRYYEVRYCSVAELSSLLEIEREDADGLIIVPLCETASARSEALAFANLEQLKHRPNWLVGVPQPLSRLASLVQELQRWDWIATSILELNADKYAREEVSRQKQATRMQLERRVQTLLGIKQFGVQTTLQWFHKGLPLKINDARQLLAELSRIFDETYSLAPHIQNELVNRRDLSSAAAAARMRLVERMFSGSHSPFLGMNPDKKPPEMSVYLSVLRHTGLHREQGGSWRIAEPHHRADKCNVLPVFRRIRETVRERPDSRVNVASLFEDLRRSPYGVRDGIMPLLLTVFAVANDKDIAFYKDGTFLREMTGETMLVLSKAPERFEIQYCRVAGVRATLLDKLVSLLDLKRSGGARVELLDVVKPLCVFVAQLPSYVLNTKKLSQKALAVRDAILEAREPTRLVFAELPKACGFEPVSARHSSDVKPFVRALKTALDELRAAYPELLERIRDRFRQEFSLAGSFQQFRTSLASRVEHVLLSVTESKLRAFCLRLMDDNLAESEWLESLGSNLALKPPSKWHDAEEDAFNDALSRFASQFHRVESILFSSKGAPEKMTAVRIAVTHATGIEQERVVHFTIDEMRRVVELEKQFDALLASDTRLALAAASRAVWKSIQNGKEPKDE
jgi:hypothetical protein